MLPAASFAAVSRISGVLCRQCFVGSCGLCACPRAANGRAECRWPVFCAHTSRRHSGGGAYLGHRRSRGAESTGLRWRHHPPCSCGTGGPWLSKTRCLVACCRGGRRRCRRRLRVQHAKHFGIRARRLGCTVQLCRDSLSIRLVRGYTQAAWHLVQTPALGRGAFPWLSDTGRRLGHTVDRRRGRRVYDPF